MHQKKKKLKLKPKSDLEAHFVPEDNGINCKDAPENKI